MYLIIRVLQVRGLNDLSLESGSGRIQVLFQVEFDSLVFSFLIDYNNFRLPSLRGYQLTALEA